MNVQLTNENTFVLKNLTKEEISLVYDMVQDYIEELLLNREEVEE